MQILLNGNEHTVPENWTIRDLVASLQLEPRFVAVECNEQLVPRATHGEQPLKAGDRVEIVTLVGGG